MARQNVLRSFAALTIRQACISNASSAVPSLPAALAAAARLGVSGDRCWGIDRITEGAFSPWGIDRSLLARHIHHLPGSQPSKGIDAESPWNTPNMLSLARGASGPFIAYLIVNEQWAPACAAVIVSGATDWLDGYLARRMGLNSVLGSYLDPLGDKLLICSVALALAFKGLIPTWVVVVVVGRDLALVAGTVVHRWHSLGWKAMPLREFLKTRAPAQLQSSDGTALQARGAGAKQTLDGGDEEAAGPTGESASGARPGSSQLDAGVPVMRPLMISKVNTVLQLSLIAGYLSKAWVAWPDPDSLHVLELATAATTGASCLAYAHKYMSGVGGAVGRQA